LGPLRAVACRGALLRWDVGESQRIAVTGSGGTTTGDKRALLQLCGWAAV
jgi:hypothetical protein